MGYVANESCIGGAPTVVGLYIETICVAQGLKHSQLNSYHRAKATGLTKAKKPITE